MSSSKITKTSTKKRNKASSPILTACDFCKRRHMKCDGRHPCFQCTKRKQECIFSAPKKRGPKPKKGVTRSKTHLESIASEISEKLAKSGLTSVPSVQELLGELERAKQASEYWKNRYFGEKEKNTSSLDSLPQVIAEVESGSFNTSNMYKPAVKLEEEMVKSQETKEKSLRLISSQLPSSLKNYNANDKFISAYFHNVFPMFPFLKLVFKTHFDLEQLRGKELSVAPSCDVEVLIGAFEYAIVCAHGAKLCGDVERQRKFVDIAENLIHYLVFKKGAHKVQALLPRIFSSILVLGYYFAGEGNIDKAVMCGMIGYSILTLNGNGLDPQVGMRVYCLLIVASESEAQVKHWFQLAENELNRVNNPNDIHPTTYLSLSAIFITKMFITSRFQYITQTNEDHSLFSRTLNYLDVAESKLESMPLNPVKLESRRKFEENCRMMIMGCRAKAYQYLGDNAKALASASSAIQRAMENQETYKETYLGVPVGLGLSAKVCAELGNFQKCIQAKDIMEKYFSKHPIAIRIASAINSSATQALQLPIHIEQLPPTTTPPSVTSPSIHTPSPSVDTVEQKLEDSLSISNVTTTPFDSSLWATSNGIPDNHNNGALSSTSMQRPTNTPVLDQSLPSMDLLPPVPPGQPQQQVEQQSADNLNMGDFGFFSLPDIDSMTDLLQGGDVDMFAASMGL